MAKPPGDNYKGLVTWSPESRNVLSVSRALANQYKLTHVSSQTSRSLFFDEGWLREAHKRCTHTIECIQLQSHSRGVDTPRILCTDVDIVDALFVRSVLDDILQLPILPFPPLPAEILLQIMQWSARCHWKPLSLRLVSSQIQPCLDPIVFSTCIIGTRSRFSHHLDLNLEMVTSRNWFSFSSPRLQRYGTYVQIVKLEIHAQDDALIKLSSLFPNIRWLVLRPLSTSQIIPTTIPLLTALECNAASFCDVGFANPLFAGLTTLSLHVTFTGSWKRCKWTSLLELNKLRYLWITAFIDNKNKGRQLLPTLKNQILPHLPTQTCFCAFHLMVPHGQVDVSKYFDGKIQDENLRSFADGSWSSRAVLALDIEPPTPIPQAVVLVPLPPGEYIWDSCRDIVDALVQARREQLQRVL
ncbi:hypothetical protein DL96DRAFT_1629621 [Flagelloscypha sp. PMI_526]|nr:hypothetical protein DL96DRAFT_1629621 [Flagelloscypha sp. PMI_526]